MKEGTKVKLVSGGPEMTVAAVGFKKSGFRDSTKCVCEYFDNGVFKSLTVSISSLTKV